MTLSPLNFIKGLTQSFTSPSAQKEYEALTRTQLVKSLRIFFLLMVIYGVYILITLFLSSLYLDGWIMLGWTLALLILWKFCVKLEKLMGLIVILVFIPIFIPPLINLKNLLLQNPVYFPVFCLGYFLGFFERIVTLQLPGMLYKFGYTLSSFLVRALIFGKIILPHLVTQMFVIFVALTFDFFKIREDQRLFQSFYDYREELIKFRTLMVSGIPSKILILSKDLKQKLFVNESFQSIIDSQGDINSQIRDFLEKLHIERNNLDPAIKLIVNSDFQHADLPLSTLQFLQILEEHSLLSDQTQKLIFDTSLHQENPLERRVFETTAFSLLWDGQDALAVILNDVTVQHQNLALKIADANKDKMLALISHELRTPLNGILGVIQLLEKDTNDSQTLQHLGVCRASGQLLLNLVNSILDLQHIRDNKFSLKVTQVNLNELLHEVYDLFKFQFEQKGLKLSLNIDPNLSVSFSTDQNRLKQILINLIGNALKFTFEGGVEITAAKIASDCLEFRVSDTGTGIKEEDQDKLFKMYGRLEEENPQVNTQGVGFGLEISNQLAKLLCEGDNEGIKFESELGKGTSFHFFIKEIPNNPEIVPKAKSRNSKKLSKNERQETDIGEQNSDELAVFQEKSDDLSRKMNSYCTRTFSKTHIESPQNNILAVSRTPTSQPLLASNTSVITKPLETEELDLDIHHTGSSEAFSFCKGTKKSFSQDKSHKILLVDDNPFNLLVARHLIENLGYETDSALNGKIAVGMLQNSGESYCAVLMDLQMPVMDGFEATKILKKMMENGEILEIPIIALSANDSLEDKRRCKEIGMKDHIAKPLDEKRLKRVLEEITKESDSSDSLVIQFTDPK